MKAMIFAAGLGTRLRPLTNDRPKALVEVDGMPLLEIVIRRLKAAGCKEMIINVHHFADLVINFIKENKQFGIQISISHEKEKLLDTGGGLKKAAWFFEDGAPFLVHNTDIVSSIDLRQLYETHCQSNALASLATRQRATSRYLLFEKESQQLIGWTNTKTDTYKWSRPERENIEKYAFSGIQIIDPKLFDYFPSEDEFSIIDTYLKAARTAPVLAYPHDEDIWLDAGKPAQIVEAARVLSQVLGT